MGGLYIRSDDSLIPTFGVTLVNTAGDILRACLDTNDDFVLENNGACGGINGSGANTNEGPGNGEFYRENGLGSTANHEDPVTGGLAVLMGSNEVASSTMDPSGNFWSGGMIWLSNANGQRIREEEVYAASQTLPSIRETFAKSIGQGDVELLVDPAPIEVGNRVWTDINTNGVQDPGEAGLDGVTVTLYDMDNSGAQVGAPVLTSGGGNFLFTGLDPNTNYEARVSLTDAILTGSSLFVTTPNADGQGSANDNKSDLRDSDGDNGGLNAGFSTIAFTTGGAGANNHTLDFGFSTVMPPEIAIEKIVNTPPTVTVGSAISFAIRVTNTGNVTITELALTDDYDSTYLTYNTAADLVGPNPASEAANDGSILWNNIVDFDGDNQFEPGEVINLTVWFIAKAETTGSVATECAPAGNTYNKASALGVDSYVEVPIAPTEPKLTLGDLVWHDINGDETKDANEPGINGVAVYLWGLDTGGSRILSSLVTTTTATVGGVMGFYEFDVPSGKNYEIEIADSNFDPGGPLAGYTFSADPDASPVGSTEQVQTASNIAAPGDDTFDFALYCEFDLALDKVVTSANPIVPGGDITFTITIYNQGAVTATGATVADYIPTGFTLSANDGNSWNGGPTGTVTKTIAGPLTAGMTTTLDIVLTAGAALSGTYTNTAEIITHTTSIVDGNGNPLPDADSTPDETDGNGPGESTDLEDDQINEDPDDGGDEDDHDPAQITVTPPASFGDRVWIENDGDGIANTGAITGVVGMVITATNGTATYTTTTVAGGYYSFTIPADTWTVTYGPVPASYGTVVPSTVVSGTAESGSAGSYQEAGDPDANHGQNTQVTVAAGETNWHVDFAFTPPPARFGDRVWIESDADGLANTGTITGVVGMVITTTNGTDTYTTTTVAGGYYSFTVPADTWTVTYGPVPTSYGAVVPSTVVSGTTENGNAGLYQETGRPDANHGQNTQVTVAEGEANWHVDFAFNLPSVPSLAVNKVLNGADPFLVGVEISYTIRITNTGGVMLTVVPLEDRYSDVFLTFDSASVTPDVSDNGGVLAWSDLTTDLGNIAPGSSVSLIVTFTTAADTTLLTPVTPCTSSGHTPNIVEIDGAMADPDGDDGTGDDVAVVQDGDDHDCAEVEILNPTAVLLANRSIGQTPEGVVVTWSTINEANIAGFYIWKANGVDVQPRSSDMIFAQNAGQSSGASYSWLDANTRLRHGDTYVLEIVHNDGTTERTVIDVMSGGNIFLPIVTK